MGLSSAIWICHGIFPAVFVDKLFTNCTCGQIICCYTPAALSVWSAGLPGAFLWIPEGWYNDHDR